jgi:hypothetical protein
LLFLPLDCNWRFASTAAEHANSLFMFGIDGAKKPSSGVTPNMCVAWNIRWMGSIWRQEAHMEMDPFESGMQNRFMPLLHILTGKDPHRQQNKPIKFFWAAAPSLRRCPFRGLTPICWHQEDQMARSRCGMQQSKHVFTPSIPTVVLFAPCFLLEALTSPALLLQALGLSFGFGERKVRQTSKVRPLAMQMLCLSVLCFLPLDPS